MPTSRGRYHHGNLREVLLTAAERMIDVDVARRFSLRELAREAGVSHAAPYQHFTGREELLLALAERWMADFVAAQAATATGTDPRRDLLALGVAYVRYASAHPSRFLTIFDASLNRPGQPPSETFATLVAQHTGLLSAAVSAAARIDVLYDDSEATAAALWAQVHGLATLVLLGHLDEGQTDAVLGALLRPI